MMLGGIKSSSTSLHFLRYLSFCAGFSCRFILLRRFTSGFHASRGSLAAVFFFLGKAMSTPTIIKRNHISTTLSQVHALFSIRKGNTMLAVADSSVNQLPYSVSVKIDRRSYTYSLFAKTLSLHSRRYR